MTSFSPSIQVAFLWILWCFFHSLLICRWWTGLMGPLFGRAFALYRILYNVLSCVTVLAVVFYQFSVKQVILFSWPGPWMVVKIVLYLYALFMFHAGWKRYDLPFFLGVRQVQCFIANTPGQDQTFTADTRGGVRHPWYSGGIALVVAFGPVTDVSLASKIVLTCYLVIGAFLEERKLHHEIGRPYSEYCKRLPMLIPWPKKK